jgi:hypothetical protein
MKQVKTIIENVEITPAIAEVLSDWYKRSGPMDDIQPKVYVNWLGKVQDYLSRIWVDMDEDQGDTETLKACLSFVIVIKDNIERFIPKENSEGGES